ncbi:MAG: serine hydrolase, partial [Thermomicrobiales bacterium]
MDRGTTWQDSVRPVAEKVLRTGAVPGVVIAVVVGDGNPEHLVLGTDADGQPLGPDSLLPIASISKLVTALAVLRLVADGELSLDDPLERRLPDAAARARV